MNTKLVAALGLAALLGLCSALNAQDAAEPVHVRIDTNHGSIVIELFPDQAPQSVENFLAYVNDGFYSGTVFHRVISYFMIQGGGYTPDLERKATREPVRNEADNGLKNERGTIAMARTPDPHSGTSQFFINVQDNPSLNYTGPENARTWGYAVFGKVVEGMDVVDEIRFLETGPRGPFRQDVPLECDGEQCQVAAVIEGASVIDYEPAEAAPAEASAEAAEG